MSSENDCLHNTQLHAWERVHILSLDDNPVFFFSNQVLVCIQREEDDIVKLELGGFWELKVN